MNAEDVLLALRDISPPPEPAWWHLSTGMLILIVAAVVLVATIWMIFRHRRTNRMATLAAEELTQIKNAYRTSGDDTKYAQHLAQWLKRVALLAFPEHQLQSVCGQKWLKFLDQSLGSDQFSSGPGQVFGGGVYQAHVNLNAAELAALCEQWLQVIRPRLKRRNQIDDQF